MLGTYADTVRYKSDLYIHVFVGKEDTHFMLFYFNDTNRY